MRPDVERTMAKTGADYPFKATRPWLLTKKIKKKSFKMSEITVLRD